MFTNKFILKLLLKFNNILVILFSDIFMLQCCGKCLFCMKTKSKCECSDEEKVRLTKHYFRHFNNTRAGWPSITILSDLWWQNTELMLPYL